MQAPGLFDKCKFAHPWLEDGVDLFDLEGLGMKDIVDATIKQLLLYATALVVMCMIFVLIVCKIFSRICCSRMSLKSTKQKKE